MQIFLLNVGKVYGGKKRSPLLLVFSASAPFPSGSPRSPPPPSPLPASIFASLVYCSSYKYKNFPTNSFAVHLEGSYYNFQVKAMAFFFCEYCCGIFLVLRLGTYWGLILKLPQIKWLLPVIHDYYRNMLNMKLKRRILILK